MKCITLAAAIFLCCAAASSRAASAPDASPACQAGRESALAGGRVTARPGETLCIRLRSSDGWFVPEAVVAGPDAAGALVLEVSLRDGQTMLLVKNPLPATLKLHAWVRRPMQGEAQATSTCPILAHLTKFEMRRYAVGELVLSDFELRPDGGPSVRDSRRRVRSARPPLR